MALATPSPSILTDYPLQYVPSPYISDPFGSPTKFPLLDVELITSLQPALLPSVSIDHSSADFWNNANNWNSPSPNSPLDQYQLPSMNTPVMHPNLVSTIKSLISESPTSSDQSCRTGGTGGFSEGSNDNQRHVAKRPSDRLKRKNGLMVQQQHMKIPDPCGLSSSPKRGSYSSSYTTASEAGEDEAKVVSVELIKNRRPFTCSHNGCSKTFKNPQTLKMHLKTHYADNSAHRLSVNTHSLTSFKAGHNKKVPSGCPICGRTFVGLYELRRHFGRKHSEGAKTHACRKCDKKFYIEVDVRDHEKLCGEPIECKCGMKFAFKCNLVAHKKGHPQCQDPTPGDSATSNISGGQQRQRSPPNRSSRLSPRRNAAAMAASRESSISKKARVSSISPPVMNRLVSPWPSMMSSSQDLSGGVGGGFSDISMSSDCSFPAVTSTYVPHLSSLSSPGIVRSDFMN